MTGEFDHVRDAWSRSLAGRWLAASSDAVTRAWVASGARGLLTSAGRARGTADQIRVIAIAVLIAILVQPVLMAMMPRTVVPSVPAWAYLPPAAVAAFVAWQAAAIVAAWPSSLLARVLRR